MTNKIPMNAVLVDPDGKSLIQKVDKDTGQVVLLTLRGLCIEVLMGGAWDTADASEKSDRFALMLKIKNVEEAELDSKEINQLQTLIGLHASTLTMGQAKELLEGRPNPLVIVPKKKS